MKHMDRYGFFTEHSFYALCAKNVQKHDLKLSWKLNVTKTFQATSHVSSEQMSNVSENLFPSSGNDVMGDHCLLFISMIGVPFLCLLDQWGIVDNPSQKPFARSCCTWNFGSEQPN
jgi:hypothetical protein